MHIPCKRPEQVVQEAFWLAYQACSGPHGMGRLQAVNDATKMQVWNNVRTAEDYDGAARLMGSNQPGRAYGDYVFGRMMKLSLEWDKAGVTCNDAEPRGDYQSWCRTYKTYEALVRAAIANVEKQ